VATTTILVTKLAAEIQDNVLIKAAASLNDARGRGACKARKWASPASW